MRNSIRRTAVFLLLVLSVFLSSCQESSAPVVLSSLADVVEPAPGDGIILARSETAGVAIQADGEATTPLVTTPEESLLVATINANLDLDNSEEQIVAIKRSDDPTDRIHLLIADFDELRGQYRITWEGVTEATNIRSFSVITSDMVGDHQLEIIAMGTDNAGNQTMDIFRRAPAQGFGSGLQFQEIFSSTTDGSIEIEEQRRTDAYRTLQSSGDSHVVVEYRRREESSNPLDLVRTVYRWQSRANRYVSIEIEEIEGERVEQAQLRELYDASADQMQAFLQGPWFRTTGEQIGDSLELAFFDNGLQEISLFRHDAQERYEWLNSYKTLYEGGPGLWINVRNSVLRTVRKQLSVTVLGLDAIRISVEGAEYWNGNYQRMSPRIQQSVLRRYAVGRPDFTLRGVFRNENNQEILFDDPAFRFRDDGLDWSGGFHLMQLDTPILELNVVESLDSATEQRTFSVRFQIEYQEQRSEDRIVRRISLVPVVLTVDGIRETGGETYTLEQVEEFRIGG